MQEKAIQEEVNQNLQNPNNWVRVFFVLLFVVIIYLVRLLLWLVVLVQIVSTLLTGKPMENLLNFGKQISAYLYQINLFLTFNSEKPPFPFAPWKPNGMQ